jgi:hypothetical protein
MVEHPDGGLVGALGGSVSVEGTAGGVAVTVRLAAWD